MNDIVNNFIFSYNNNYKYDVIPLEPDDRIYNRARIKRETRQAFENYFMQGEDDGR